MQFKNSKYPFFVCLFCFFFVQIDLQLLHILWHFIVNIMVAYSTGEDETEMHVLTVITYIFSSTWLLCIFLVEICLNKELKFSNIHTENTHTTNTNMGAEEILID